MKALDMMAKAIEEKNEQEKKQKAITLEDVLEKLNAIAEAQDNINEQCSNLFNEIANNKKDEEEEEGEQEQEENEEGEVD